MKSKNKLVSVTKKKHRYREQTSSHWGEGRGERRGKIAVRN